MNTTTKIAVAVVAMRVIPTTFAVMALAVMVGFGPVYRHAEYTIELPDGWDYLPPELLEYMSDSVGTAFDVSFVPVRPDGGFVPWPLATIHRIPYDPGGIDEQVALTMAESLTSIPLEQRFQDAADRVFEGAVALETTTAHLDWPNRRLTYTATTTTLGVPTFIETTLLFGGEVISLIFTDTVANWERSTPSREHLIATLRATRPAPVNAIKFLGIKIMYWVYGTIGLAVVALLRHRRRTP